MGTTFVSDEEFREEFFRVFREEDMVRIVFLFDRQMVPGDHAKALFARMGARKITKYLNFVLFSIREGATNEFMVAHMQGVADKVRGLSYSKGLHWYVFGLNDSFRSEMCIEHQVLGGVHVTQDAWVRFFEKAPKQIVQRFVSGTKLDADRMHLEMCGVFSGSEPRISAPKHEMRRFFTDQCRDAKHFLHTETGLCFVVVREGFKSVMVTVEKVSDMRG